MSSSLPATPSSSTSSLTTSSFGDATTLSDAAANSLPVMEKTLEGTVKTANVSALDLFLGADIVVQIVMLLLLSASIWSWTLIFAKSTQLRSLHKAANLFEEKFWSQTNLSALYSKLKGRTQDSLSHLFFIGMSEWQRSSPSDAHALDRIHRILMLTINKEREHIERHMTFLASVGSTAPFVGLFGTVWGIMNSFQGIALSGSTNLAVVAPGIAEALFATALGLVAAIPAVLSYNFISSKINNYAARLDNFADEFITMLESQPRNPDA